MFGSEEWNYGHQDSLKKKERTREKERNKTKLKDSEKRKQIRKMN